MTSLPDTRADRPIPSADQIADLVELLDTPGPSGFEAPVAEAWRQLAQRGGAEVRVDAVGNSYATVNSGAARRVAIIGHVDEIGLIVTRIDDKGFLRCTSIGGWDVAVLVGQRVRVLTEHGPVIGSVSRPAVHVLQGADKERVPKLSALWIDIGAEDGDDARSRVRVGDAAVIDVVPIRLGQHRLLSRSIDNRVGAFVSLQAALACSGLDVEVTAIGSIGEEIGGAGAVASAYSLAPDAAIVVDVTTPGDTPSAGDTGDLYLGRGPIVTRGATTTAAVVDELLAAADAAKLPCQLRGLGIRTRTDADSVVRAGGGVPVALVSIPARYLHSPCEQVDLRDVQTGIELIAAWAARRAES